MLNFFNHFKTKDEPQNLVNELLTSYSEHITNISRISKQQKGWEEHYRAGLISEQQKQQYSDALFHTAELIPLLTLHQHRTRLSTIAFEKSLNCQQVAFKLEQCMRTFIFSYELSSDDEPSTHQREQLLLNAFQDIDHETAALILSADQLTTRAKELSGKYREYFESFIDNINAIQPKNI